MLKHFDSSLSFINNETKIALYIEIIKPLILNLPDINDKVKAIAWFRKIIFDNSSLIVRIEYLELLFEFLKHRKLSGFFAGLPDTKRPLQKFNKKTKIQQFTRYDNKIKHFIAAPSKNVDNYRDNYLPQKNNCNTFRRKHIEVIHSLKNSEHNMQCLKKNNRISAGYSPLTKTGFEHKIKNIMNSPGNDNEKLNRCKAMLGINCLPPIKSDERNLIRHNGKSKSTRCGKRDKYFDTYNVTPTYKIYKSTIENYFCKPKDNCINRMTNDYESPVNEKVFQQVHDNNNTVKNSPIKAKLKEENKQNIELDQYCGISTNNELESFLMGSKKYLTLCVSKECLVERNILKCIKYIIRNAQCKFFKFKNYCNSEKIYSMTKPRKTHDISKKHHDNSFLNKEIGRKKNENNQIFLFNNSILTRLQNLFVNKTTFANASNTFQNVLGKYIYIQISLILAVGTIFFWKIYQIIFTYQCKKMSYTTQVVSQIYNFRKDVCSSYVFIFVGCFILYQFVKDLINSFF